MKSMTISTASALALATFATTAQADMEKAQAILDEHRQMPVFEAPGEPFDAATCMADKSIYTVPVTMAVPFVVALTDAMERAASEVGFDLEIWNNQGGMDAWTQGMSQAIAGGYDLVDVSAGLDPALLIPQIVEAKAAGMSVTTTHLYDETQTEFEMVDASAKIPYTRAGEIMAAWAYVKSEGTANVLIIGSDDVVPTAAFVKSIQDTLAELCPDCGQQYINVPLAEWGTKIQSGVQSAILADPSINYILPIYDSMSQFVIPGLRIAGAPDVPIISFNGTPFVLDMVRSGEVEMIVGEGLGWAGYASVDVQMRLLCGLPVPDTLNIPLLIFDETNIDTVSDPATFDSGYGDAHLAGFRSLWGLE